MNAIAWISVLVVAEVENLVLIGVVLDGGFRDRLSTAVGASTSVGAMSILVGAVQMVLQGGSDTVAGFAIISGIGQVALSVMAYRVALKAKHHEYALAMRGRGEPAALRASVGIVKATAAGRAVIGR